MLPLCFSVGSNCVRVDDDRLEGYPTFTNFGGGAPAALAGAADEEGGFRRAAGEARAPPRSFRPRPTNLLRTKFAFPSSFRAHHGCRRLRRRYDTVSSAASGAARYGSSRRLLLRNPPSWGSSCFIALRSASRSAPLMFSSVSSRRRSRRLTKTPRASGGRARGRDSVSRAAARASAGAGWGSRAGRRER